MEKRKKQTFYPSSLSFSSCDQLARIIEALKYDLHLPLCFLPINFTLLQKVIGEVLHISAGAHFIASNPGSVSGQIRSNKSAILS